MTGGSESETGTETSGTPDSRMVPCQRRQYVIQFLHEVDNPTGLTEIARHVAAIESGRAVEEVSPAHLRATYLDLYERHIPALVASDRINYSQSDGTVSLQPEPKA